MTNSMLLFYKNVDYSVLTAGLTIPIQHQESVFSELGFTLERGQRKQIQILIDGTPYPAQIINIRFDKSKYPTHRDLLQIRYSAKSTVAQKLQELFVYSKKQIALQRQYRGNGKLPNIDEAHPKRVVKDFLIKFTEKPQKSARSTSMLLTLRWVRLLASA